MNTIDGFELKKLIFEDEKLRINCIPFLFWSTTEGSPTIEKAYSYNVQGYFVEPTDFEILKSMIQAMISYWGYSEFPNSR